MDEFIKLLSQDYNKYDTALKIRWLFFINDLACPFNISEGESGHFISGYTKTLLSYNRDLPHKTFTERHHFVA